MLFIISVSLHAEAISEISYDVHGTGKSSRSSYHSDYKQQGGYETQVNVLDSEKKFDRVRFVPRMFSEWLSLYVETQAYELISQLGELGYVSQDGTLKESVRDLPIPLTPKKVIQKDDIIDYYEQKYPVSWIYDELTRVNVLDQQGFLVNTESFSDEFNKSDFQQYYPSIKKIDFNFSNKAIEEELLRELLRFLQESSLSIQVTQEETVRYVSRKEGFFESFLDQIGGNLLGRLFFKDKVSTVKQKLSYSPSLYVTSMFTNLRYGFSKSTYYGGARGDVIFYGLDQRDTLELNYGKGGGNNHFSSKLSLLTMSPEFSDFSTLVSSSGGIVMFDQLSDKSDYLQWYSLRYQMGVLDEAKEFNGSIGLSLLNDTNKQVSKLGLGIGLNGVFNFFSHFGMYYMLDTNFGFNLFKESPENWGLSNYGLGIQTGIHPIRARFGYEWITTHAKGRSVYDAITASLTAFF